MMDAAACDSGLFRTNFGPILAERRGQVDRMLLLVDEDLSDFLGHGYSAQDSHWRDFALRGLFELGRDVHIRAAVGHLQV